jgi:farnesyl diphosphate synthase
MLASATEADFAAWMGSIQARIEAALARNLPGPQQVPARLHQAMRYATLEGGKRVRPLLTFAAGELVGADAARLDIVACAVEMIHSYSLVHDDMPCIDNDVLRRGKRTVHVEYDEATALLVGDALQTLAFQLLADHVLAGNPAAQLAMVKTLAVAAGSRGMAGGQAIDLASTGKTLSQAELEYMHVRKTGALISAAVKLGALCAGPCPAALEQYANRVGLAFQVVDDVLDAEASTATLGKTAGKDAKQGKPTYVSAMGVARARQFAEELRLGAHAALDALDDPGAYGQRAQRLRQVADFVVLRKF